ncbi:MAG TPA: tRNA epoxyqueuosine(34) reductase QueG, partial [Gemmatimonadales bacterium]|nr:tRNA epoxyqueuosine(34) reductase QueG [Gemmatimonadales bacterium]
MKADQGTAAPTTEALAAWARELGFGACGVASLEQSRYGDALDQWLQAGYAGTMRYLHRQAHRRKEPASIVPGARVAVVVLENYLPAERLPGTGGRGQGGSVKVAKYGRGTDYHRALKARLELLAAWLCEQGATIAHPWTDSGPVPERELAQRAGLGWIGKNTMLIRPGSGSFCFIGTVFTDLPLEPSPAADLDRCGSCTRCLDACPTEAFVEARVLDATRCISYLTIESGLPIPDSLADRLEGWAFGCDICNDICPWNVRFAEPSGRPEYQDRGAIGSDDPDFFEQMTPAEFAARFGDTPLERSGLPGMRRNWRAAFRSRRSGHRWAGGARA